MLLLRIEVDGRLKNSDKLLGTNGVLTLLLKKFPEGAIFINPIR
jgi:hypothetical protein